MLRHASAVMTLDRYADLFDDDLDAVGDRLDAVRRSCCCAGLSFAILAVGLIRLWANDSGPVGGGRYWDRTSDPCRVKAVLSR